MQLKDLEKSILFSFFSIYHTNECLGDFDFEQNFFVWMKIKNEGKRMTINAILI